VRDDLTLAILQYDIYSDDINKNLSLIDHMIMRLTAPVDLILLPEMFCTGFTMNPALFSADDHHRVLRWLNNLAVSQNAFVAGSHPFPEGDKFYNRFFFISPRGNVEYYDKRHPFTFSGEDKVYSPGTERKVIHVRNWKVFPLVCYDLRFPVWSRNDMDYDLLIYAANWPAARNSVWDILLGARAIENQCYVAGINRTGTDSKGIRYIGNSRIISPKGDQLYKAGKKEEVIQYTLRKDTMLKYRKKFPVLMDRDNFILDNSTLTD
jgi:omega-amidase